MPDKKPETEASRATITVALDPQYHAYVLEQAKSDERTPAKWLKRFIQAQIALDAPE